MGLILYISFLCYIVFFRTKFSIETDYWNTIRYNINIIPFRTIKQYISELNNWYAVKNIAGNIVIFLPLGYILFQRKIGLHKGVIFSTLLIVGIELIQLFFLRGICDVDDLILNICGVVIGYLLTCVINKFKKHNIC